MTSEHTHRYEKHHLRQEVSGQHPCPQINWVLDCIAGSHAEGRAPQDEGGRVPFAVAAAARCYSRCSGCGTFQWGLDLWIRGRAVAVPLDVGHSTAEVGELLLTHCVLELRGKGWTWV